MLTGLQKLIKEGAEVLRGPMKEAYDKARIAAEKIEGLVRDHPLYAAAIIIVIALGVLVILSPVLIHGLGFTAAGVEAGKLREMFIFVVNFFFLSFCFFCFSALFFSLRCSLDFLVLSRVAFDLHKRKKKSYRNKFPFRR